VPTPTLSVIIPAYNERDRLPPTLRATVAFLRTRDYSWEIIVSDDGSRDGTSAIVARFAEDEPAVRLVVLPVNRGKGAAVRAGVAASRGSLVLICDADMATPIEQVESLIDALDSGADLAIGSRAAAGATAKRTPVRALAGRVFSWALRLMAGPAVAGIRDTQCGFKLLRGDQARALFATLTIDGFAFDVELMMRASHLRILEVPVEWREIPGSKVSLVRDSVRMLRDVARARAAISRSRRLEGTAQPAQLPAAR
jgi:dolichyl-phosphate beta-glucosyltransferase